MLEKTITVIDIDGTNYIYCNRSSIYDKPLTYENFISILSAELKKNKQISVAYLYALIGMEHCVTSGDHEWGWTSINNIDFVNDATGLYLAVIMPRSERIIKL